MFSLFSPENSYDSSCKLSPDTCEAKIQNSLLIRAVWSESSLCAFRIADDANFLHRENEGSDQTELVIICVFNHENIPIKKLTPLNPTFI